MRYRATYHKKGHVLGGGAYTYHGIAEGGGWKDGLGQWWINFTTESGVFFGAVPLEDVVVGSVLSTEQCRAMADKIARV
jgi:hypothetical protein